MGKNIARKLVKTGYAQPIFTSDEAIDADKKTIALGVESKLLMENAGAAVADFVDTIIKIRKIKTRIIIFAGPGNNGADAIVCARHLFSKHLRFKLYLLADQKNFKSDMQFQLGLLRNLINIAPARASIATLPKDFSIKRSSRFTIIIDGIFGAGINRAPNERALDAIVEINNSKQRDAQTTLIVSIDVPSGLSLEACAPIGEIIRADHTITFGLKKRVHISEPTKNFCGKTHVHDIGLMVGNAHHNFFIHGKKALIPLLHRPKDGSHKGQFGHILVLEGHEYYLGASRLAARAALRVGAGLVTIAEQKHEAKSTVDFPELMRRPVEKIDEVWLKKIDALVVGPGLSDQKIYQENALTLLNKFSDEDKLIVLDADGLRLLKHQNFLVKNNFIVATPHPKEAAGLLGCTVLDIERDRFLAIEELAKINSSSENHVIWVLKGRTTLVRALSGEIFAFKGDAPVLSCAGSGDVLSGAIAGLCKQTSSPLASALLAISLQISAATILSKSIFKGSFASELADLFPQLTKTKLTND